MQELYQQIEQYLDDAMTPDQRQAFEAAVQADPALAAELALVRAIRSDLKAQWAAEANTSALKETLSDLGQEFFKPDAPGPKRWRYWLWLLMAAAFAYLGYRMLRPAPPANPQQLYAFYKQFPEAALTQRGSAASEDSLSAGERFFNAQQYDKALQMWQDKAVQANADPELRFFTALCMIETSQEKQAQNWLAALNHAQSGWQEEARWFLALSFLKTGDQQACRDILQQIPATDKYAEKAQKLLHNL
jgi:thioredoxin-like negative regulator of GroEL